MHASDAVHVFEYSRGKRTTEDVGQSLGTVPKSHSERQFFSDIPGRGHEGDSGKEGALGETDDESGGCKATGAVDQGKEGGGNRPAEPGIC